MLEVVSDPGVICILRGWPLTVSFKGLVALFKKAGLAAVGAGYMGWDVGSR